jgi:hypothetical protein
MWLNCYCEDPCFNPSSYPHVPNVRTENGLRDIMAIGNILELGTVLDRRCYSSSGVHWRERIEMGSSRAMYRRLQSIISRKFVLSVEGQPVLPLVVFARSLVEFAAAVVVYKEDMESAGHKIQGCLSTKVKDKMVTLFRLNYPELLPKLLSLIDSRAEYLYWTGPSISITSYTDAYDVFRRRAGKMVKNKPLRDFTDFPIYVDDGNESPEEEDSIPEEPIPAAVDDVVAQDAKMSDANNGFLGQEEEGSVPVQMEVDSSTGDQGQTGGAEVDAGAENQDMDVDPADGIKNADADVPKTGSHEKAPISKESSSGGRRVLTRGRKGAAKSVGLSEKVVPNAEEGSSSTGGKAASANRKGKSPAKSSQKLTPVMEEGSSSNGQKAASGGRKGKRTAEPSEKMEEVQPVAKRTRRKP